MVKVDIKYYWEVEDLESDPSGGLCGRVLDLGIHELQVIPRVGEKVIVETKNKYHWPSAYIQDEADYEKPGKMTMIVTGITHDVSSGMIHLSGETTNPETDELLRK
jgi:hypothetical protein